MIPDPTSRPVASPQFIVSAAPLLLQQIINDLLADPNVNVLEVSGSPTSPERAVVQMAEIKAEELRQAFGEQVKVEPDLPLTMFP